MIMEMASETLDELRADVLKNALAQESEGDKAFTTFAIAVLSFMVEAQIESARQQERTANALEQLVLNSIPQQKG